jgi:hypothetical protein
MAKSNLGSLENCILACREYTQLWQEFFTFFSDDLSDKVFLEEDERRFQELVQLLAEKHFRFTQMVGNRFSGANDVLKILSEAVSLSYLKTLPEASFTKLQVDWHTLFLNMNKCLGKLLTEIPPARLQKMQQ